MNGSSSGQVHGTPGTQNTLEQNELSSAVAENESNTKQEHEKYLKTELPKGSPIKIPLNAQIKEENKNGYSQVKYTWERKGYKYTSRWHTRTPNAPKGQKNSWVVQRDRPGIGFGKNARPAKHEILIGKNKWISKKEWQSAIRARKNGTATKKQKEILDNGHWKDDR